MKRFPSDMYTVTEIEKYDIKRQIISYIAATGNDVFVCGIKVWDYFLEFCNWITQLLENVIFAICRLLIGIIVFSIYSNKFPTSRTFPIKFHNTIAFSEGI